MPAPTVTSIRSISSTRVRLDFSEALLDNSALRDPVSYTLATSTSSAVVPAILEVFVPGTGATRTIDLVTSEMTDGASYTVVIDNTNIAGVGGAVDPGPWAFTGIGIDPSILVVVATSPTTAEIRFNEGIKDFGVVRDPSAYVFDGGLTTVDVLALDNDIVIIETSTQTEGSLYSLQLIGDFFDNANNFVSTPAAVPMLGFSAAGELEPSLQLNMYNFIIKIIRDEDQVNGRKFLERFLKGPQEAWKATNDILLGIPKLWSIVDIPDEFLPLQKNIVGWTKGYDTFTHRLEPAVLRRLIANSIEFWGKRGPEDAIEDILNLVVGANLRIFTYFDWRWISGETHMGEEHDGFDPWLISELPEGSNVFQIRIVDDGTLDHDLIKEVVRVCRPVGERIEIFYLAFYDRFLVDNDKSQWTDADGVSQVTGGSLILPASVDPEEAFVSVLDSAEWNQYAVTFQVFGSVAYDLIFYRTSATDQYFVRVETAPAGVGFGSVEIFKIASGIETSIASVDMTFDYQLLDDIYYTFRIEIVDGGAANEIRVVIDANQVLVATDASHSSGTVGVRRDAGSGELNLNECEIFKLPAISDFIDINS